MNEATITVSGMTCMGCVGSVKRILSQLPGVSSVEIDLGSGKVRIVHDERIVKLDTLRQAIDDSGYKVTDR